MTKSVTESMVELATLTGKMVESIAEQEAAALRLMQAEMQAMASVASAAATSSLPKKPEGDAADEAEIEDGFDNLPL